VADRLLVIEGDATLRDAYAAHFSPAGFDVRCATSVGEVLALPAGTPFDAVIANVGGEWSALTPALMRWLAAAGAPPVLVVTAYGEPARATEAARLGADAFLHKPPSLVWLEWLLRSRIEAARLSASSEAASG
jgi:DNA-binding response OmpR family regulator